MRFLYSCFLLLMVFAAGAQGTSNEITGVVKDMDSGLPLAGAVVTVNFNWQPFSTSTDSSGRYTMRTNVQYADGNFPVQVVKGGYYELNGFIHVQKASSFNFSLKKRIEPVKADTVPAISFEGLATNNWVFLLDISASMNTPDKLPLIQQGLKKIVELFRDKDQVAIVTFSGSATALLPTTNGMNKTKILQAIDAIKPGGKSEGESAVNEAYAVALQQYIPGGNNRIIIATDGLFTSGDKDLKAIKKTIEKHLAKDIRCSVLIVGKPGELTKQELQQIAETGKGNFALIPDEATAVKKLFEETQAVK